MGQLLVVEPHYRLQRRVKVAHVHATLGRNPSYLVGGSKRIPRLHSRAR
jgi:hypothetical protein